MNFVIEPASDPAPGCPCCDPLASAPQGFVTRDDEAVAVYFGDWTRTPVPSADIVVSLGRWDALSQPKDRRTIAFRLTRAAQGTKAELLDAQVSRWAVVDFAGEMLDEAAARRDPDLEEFRAIVLEIAAKDERIADALAGPGNCSLRLSRRSGTVQRFRVEAAEWR
ncbi:hypothetical protein C8N35_1011580 [Breoghania corrubedonensis]|uniref:Uncharacterized protein n=1 Tax=Breoghania corrubedonensis TaxID=665038 RepID=A0A2T5VIH7_9HYPH|nr:hypothetical protein [Breoghania corrubedonensis]PTW63526.1 hypothetical protein C8N35_1011580 [Breoghania corrubedonensis]